MEMSTNMSKKLGFMAAAILIAGVVGAADAATIFNGANSNGTANGWNDALNWTAGIPTGTMDVTIESGKDARANAAVGAYTGSLTLESNARLQLDATSATLNALGTGTITMNTGSIIATGSVGSVNYGAIVLNGDATIQGGYSTQGHHTQRNLTAAISGPGSLTFIGTNNNTVNIGASNTFDGFETEAHTGFGAGKYQIQANVAGSLGVGDVTIGNLASLEINHIDALSASAVLALNDGNGKLSTKLVLDYDGTKVVSGFFIDGVDQGVGVFDSTSHAGAISGSGKIEVVPEPASLALLAMGGLLIAGRRR